MTEKQNLADDLDDFGKCNFDDYEKYLADNQITVSWDPGTLVDVEGNRSIDERFAGWVCNSPIGGESLGGAPTPEGERYARRAAAILIFLVKKGVFWPAARELAICYVRFTDELEKRRAENAPPRSV